MTNVDLATKAYSSFAKGDVEAVLAVFDPAIVWHECKGMPFVKGDGIFKGHEAINRMEYLTGLQASQDILV